MKRELGVALILLLCLLTACAQPDLPEDPSNEVLNGLDMETTASTNDPESETTESTDGTAEPHVPEWLPQQPQKLSYEEYFSEDRPYTVSDKWLVPDGNAWKGYFLRMDYTYGLQVCLWTPYSMEGDTAIYTVPNTVEFAKWSLVGTDGTTAYLTQQVWDGRDCIIAIDLLTGSREHIVKNTVIGDTVYCGDVLYYAEYSDDMVKVVRHYLPTGDEMNYPTGQKIMPMFSIDKIDGSTSPITWTGVTAEMTAAVISELQNPDSEFRLPRPNGTDLSVLWEMEEPWIYAERNPIHWLCSDLQNVTGYRTLYQCTILQDGSVESVATGVVDSCWYGSDYGHDHLNPDAPPPAEPTGSIGSWNSFVQKTSSVQEQEYELPWMVYGGNIYAVDGNTYTLVTDLQVQSLQYADARYAITEDDRLVRFTANGEEYTVLYQGQDLDGTCFRDGNMLYIIDGDSIIQLDPETQRYRTVFTHEDLSWAYCDSENVLYICLLSGLHEASYLYDLTTGEFTKTGYRL